MGLIITLMFLVFAASNNAFAEFEDVKKLALANNDFAFKLHETFSSEGNLFFSPASVFIALGMLYQGARGTTQEEMHHVLSSDVEGVDHQSLNQNFQELLSLIAHSSDQYNLDIANAIISQAQSFVSGEYKEILKNYYDATVREVDFVKDNANAIQEINSWVSNKTHHKIPKLLESLDPNTVLVLLNAVYFKGSWNTKFSLSETRDQIFYNDGIDAVSVPMMNARYRVLYGEQQSFKALKLPYKDGDISMVLLLPNDRNGLNKIEEAVTASKLDSIIRSMESHFVTIDIPKFKLEDSKDLKESLARLGMNSAFSNGANFGGISEEVKLKVSQIVHKAVVEVNEEGSEAAAGTGIEIIPVSYPGPPILSFRADHPFLFFIIHEEIGMILFCGRVSKL